jgi:hypothetical protein
MRGHLIGLAAALAAWLATTEAGAHDFQLGLGMSGHGTEWRGDGGGYGSLKLGVRFIDLVGVYLEGREGYATVDQRMLTLVSLGAQVWGRLGITRPYARLGFLHQHEESLAVFTDDVGSALFGVGDGIRHRFGGELGLGLDVPFWTRKDLSFFVGVEARGAVFPDDLGPLVYAGGGLNVGMSYEL